MSATPPTAKALFLAAINLPPEARPEFLRERCGPDDALRRRVEALLAAHARVATEVPDPVPDEDATAPFADAAGDGTADLHGPGAGAAVGPYRLREPLGEGGMGLVFAAEQTEPVRRTVALKVIKPGMDTKQVVARFEAERQALALMDHPNIARVHDGGTTPDGRPFFVMELVKGESITDYCDRNRLTVRQRLGLFLQVCRAVQHAHQKGVIHRDLKPSNVLVAVHDTDPVAKVIDFGVAKAVGQPLTDKTLFTGFAQLVGTPLYMSPEQAGESSLDVDTRTDVYALGVLLYELLTGATPIDPEAFRTAGLDELRRMIREDDPDRPSARLSTLNAAALATVADRRNADPRRLAREVRGELDWVVMKCLEKDRDCRYETASALAADVQRYLAGEPVEAHPPSAAYRLRKFARRNRTALTIAAVVVITLSAGAGGAAYLIGDRAARRADAERRIDEGLAEVERLYTLGRWQAARDVVAGLEPLLAGGSSQDRRSRIEEWKADLDLVSRVAEIRLGRGLGQNPKTDAATADALYAAAFREYGVHVESLDPVRAAELLRARPARVELAAAVDDWAFVRGVVGGPGAGEGRERLLDVARLADPDPDRSRFRAALIRNDRAELLALAAAPEAVDLPPASVFTLGNALHAIGEDDRAVELMIRVRPKHAGDFWINIALGSTLLDTTRLTDAVRFLTAACAANPLSPGSHLNLGIGLTRVGRPEEAGACFREAIRLRPDYAAAHNNLSRALISLGKYEEAVACCREAIRIEPENAEPHLDLGNALFNLGRPDEAAASYREAIRLDPGYAMAHYNLGNALKKLARPVEAAASYREAIRINPDYGEAHNNLGTLLEKLGKPAEAMACFREAIRTSPELFEPHNNLGDAYLRQDKPREAAACYQQVVRIKPDHIQALLHLGNALTELGRFDEAAGCYRKAIRIKPDYPEAHTNLGRTLQQMGKPAEAASSYREAIRVGPDFFPAYNNLAWLLATHPNTTVRDPAGAVAAARRAVQLAPQEGGIRNTLGVALYRSGDWAGATKALSESIRLGQGGSSADFFFLAMAHARLGDSAEARAWYAKGVGWMSKNAPRDAELIRFRAEAAELLGLVAPPPRLKSP